MAAKTARSGEVQRPSGLRRWSTWVSGAQEMMKSAASFTTSVENAAATLVDSVSTAVASVSALTRGEGPNGGEDAAATTTVEGLARIARATRDASSVDEFMAAAGPVLGNAAGAGVELPLDWLPRLEAATDEAATQPGCGAEEGCTADALPTVTDHDDSESTTASAASQGDSAAEVEQMEKDLARDSVRINGSLLLGSDGRDGVVDALAGALAGAAGVNVSDDGTAKKETGGSDDAGMARQMAVDLLVQCKRTDTGGDALRAVMAVLHNPTLVALAVSSELSTPLTFTVGGGRQAEGSAQANTAAPAEGAEDAEVDDASVALSESEPEDEAAMTIVDKDTGRRYRVDDMGELVEMSGACDTFAASTTASASSETRVSGVRVGFATSMVYRVVNMQTTETVSTLTVTMTRSFVCSEGRAVASDSGTVRMTAGAP